MKTVLMGAERAEFITHILEPVRFSLAWDWEDCVRELEERHIQVSAAYPLMTHEEAKLAKEWYAKHDLKTEDETILAIGLACMDEEKVREVLGNRLTDWLLTEATPSHCRSQAKRELEFSDKWAVAAAYLWVAKQLEKK